MQSMKAFPAGVKAQQLGAAKLAKPRTTNRPTALKLPAAEKRKWYIYNPDQPRTQHELDVIRQGFSFASTTVLRAGERLGKHQHTSPNTHLVIEGTIKIGKAHDDGDLRLRGGNAVKVPGTNVDMPAKVDYGGVAGDNGCTFVEGHKVLSPTTAERFERRGTIVAAAANHPYAFTTGNQPWAKRGEWLAREQYRQ